MKYAFAAGVAAYISDKAVMTAVESLLSYKPSKLDVDQWDEIVPFYRAYAGAQAIKTEWAAALFEVFDQVWGVDPPESWNLLPPKKGMSLFEWGLDLDHLWKDESLVKVFQRSETFMLQAISFDLDQGVQLGFGVFDKRQKSLLSGIFDYDLGATDLRWSPDGLVPLKSEVDLSELEELAIKLIADCNDQLVANDGDE